MVAVANLDALIPRTSHMFVDDLSSSPQPGVRELQALNNIDIALAPEHMDHDALEQSRRLLDTQSHSDDLRLPPPPRQSDSGVVLYRRVAAGVAKFRERAGQPVVASPAAIEAETRLMAACQGICRFQDEILGARERPSGALAERMMGRSF